MSLINVRVTSSEIADQYKRINKAYEQADLELLGGGSVQERKLILSERNLKMANLYNLANKSHIDSNAKKIAFPTENPFIDKHYNVSEVNQCVHEESDSTSFDAEFIGVAVGVAIATPFGPIAALLSGFFTGWITSCFIQPKPIQSWSIDQIKDESEGILKVFFSEDGEVYHQNVLLEHCEIQNNLESYRSVDSEPVNDESFEELINSNQLAQWLTFPFSELNQDDDMENEIIDSDTADTATR